MVKKPLTTSYNLSIFYNRPRNTLTYQPFHVRPKVKTDEVFKPNTLEVNNNVRRHR